MIENICSQFKFQIKIKRLLVDDGIWIARHKHLDNEYVIDFIVERKKYLMICGAQSEINT